MVRIAGVTKQRIQSPHGLMHLGACTRPQGNPELLRGKLAEECAAAEPSPLRLGIDSFQQAIFKRHQNLGHDSQYIWISQRAHEFQHGKIAAERLYFDRLR